MLLVNRHTGTLISFVNVCGNRDCPRCTQQKAKSELRHYTKKFNAAGSIFWSLEDVDDQTGNNRRAQQRRRKKAEFVAVSLIDGVRHVFSSKDLSGPNRRNVKMAPHIAAILLKKILGIRVSRVDASRSWRRPKDASTGDWARVAVASEKRINAIETWARTEAQSLGIELDEQGPSSKLDVPEWLKLLEKAKGTGLFGG